MSNHTHYRDGWRLPPQKQSSIREEFTQKIMPKTMKMAEKSFLPAIMSVAVGAWRAMRELKLQIPCKTQHSELRTFTN